MPNINSAKKRLRQTVKRRMRSRMRQSRVNTAERKLRQAVAAGDTEALPALLASCFSELDRAAKHGTIHRNTADRKKQRLNAMINRSQ